MAQYMGRAEGHSNSVTCEYSVANGVTVTSGDFVTLNADGRVALATGTTPLLGTVEGGNARLFTTQVNNQAATGNAAGTVKVLVNIERDARYLVKTPSALTEANVGDVIGVAGATGAQTTGAGSNLIIKKLGEGLRGADNTHAVVQIVDHQFVG